MLDTGKDVGLPFYAGQAVLAQNHELTEAQIIDRSSSSEVSRLCWQSVISSSSCIDNSIMLLLCRRVSAAGGRGLVQIEGEVGNHALGWHLWHLL